MESGWILQKKPTKNSSLACSNSNNRVPITSLVYSFEVHITPLISYHLDAFSRYHKSFRAMSMLQAYVNQAMRNIV